MKILTVLAVAYMLAPGAFAQSPELPAAPTAAPKLELLPGAPLENVVLFGAPRKDGTMIAFFKDPDGNAAFVSVGQLGLALSSGYRPVTVQDLSNVADGYVATIREQQKRIEELTAQYNSLVQSFNQLAANTSKSPVAVYAQQPQPSVADTARLMILQSFLSRNAPPQQINVKIKNCSVLPALCAGP